MFVLGSLEIVVKANLLGFTTITNQPETHSMFGTFVFFVVATLAFNFAYNKTNFNCIILL